MTTAPRFLRAFPFQADVLALPVRDLDATAAWYSAHFGLREVERRDQPVPAVVLERDGTRLGFAVNGGDATQDGAAVLVAGIDELRDELAQRGAAPGDVRIDDRNGQQLRVFFVVAPDGLCYYFHEPIIAA